MKASEQLLRRVGRATGALRLRRLESRVGSLEVGFAEEAVFRDRQEERLRELAGRLALSVDDAAGVAQPIAARHREA